MSGASFITLLFSLFGFLSQLNWIFGHGSDSIWPLRLLLGALLPYLLAKMFFGFYEKKTKNKVWRSFPRFLRFLSKESIQNSLCLLFFLCVYLLSMGGHFYSYDDRFRFETTKAMVDRGELTVSLPPGSWPSHSKYGIVQPVLTVPFYVLGKALKNQDNGLKDFDEVLVSTFMQIITAFALLVCFLLLKEWGYSAKLSLTVVFVLGLTSMFWPYAKLFFTEPFNGLCLVFALFNLIRFKNHKSNKNLLISGTSLGVCGMNATMIFVTAVPIFSLYAAWLLWPRNQGICESWKEAIIKAAFFALPILGGLVFVLGFNAYRYGSIFNTGYVGDRGFKTIIQDGVPGFSIPWFIGVYGLLFSSGKSLFLYNPTFILALMGLKSFWMKNKAEAWLIIGLFMLWLGFYSKWWAWHGDVCWGPRYLLPVLGLAMLPMAEYLKNWNKRFWLGKGIFAVLLVVGLIVQLFAISAPFYTYFQATEGVKQANWHLLHYVPHFSPLWGQVKVVFKGMNVDFYLQKSVLSLVLAWLGAFSGVLLWVGVWNLKQVKTENKI